MQLWVQRLFAAGLPDELDALFVTSDLQGWSFGDTGSRLLGLAVADELRQHCEGSGIDPARVGVLLAGDLFAREDLSRRGGVGDVRGVWRAFAAQHGFVAGVAGNHDAFGDGSDDVVAFAAEPGIHLLDYGTPGLVPGAQSHGLRIAGVSGIVGNPDKPWRKSRADLATGVERALALQPDVLLLHQNPGLPDVRRPDHTWLTELLTAQAQALVVFGHSYCHRPVLELGGCQLLASEGRAFWIERGD
jgi:hypothetical protein